MFYIELIYLGFFITFALSGHNSRNDLTTIYEWSQLEFDYPSSYMRQEDIECGNFIPGVPFPMDTDAYYSYEGENKIFVTIPKFQNGTPASLGTVSSKKLNGNPVITPYPSWKWHKNPEKCKNNRIVSVFRISIDECGRLWVLDTGKVLDRIRPVCPPQILIFDLKTDTLIHKYEIPPSQLDDRSLLVTPVVEVLSHDHRCQDSFAYLADCQSFAIIVYDLRKDMSWKATDKTMFPNPEFGEATIQGETFELMDGVLGMSLSPNHDDKRKLYYHALSSGTEHWVYTSHLRNESLFSGGTSPKIFNTFKGRRLTQAAAEAMDSNGIMYFGLVGDVQMACFNTKAGDYGSWKSSDIISDNPIILQFASGVKVIRNKKRDEELWALTCRLQKVLSGTLNSKEPNFRILAAKTSDLIHETQCMKGDGVIPPVTHFQHTGGYGHYNFKH